MRPVPIVIGLAASVFFSLQPNLKAAEGTTKFDGSWAVTLDAKIYKNPDGSTAQPYVRNFSATVKKGILQGEVGTSGQRGWYELSGTISADGTAALRAEEITKYQKYSFTTSSKKPPEGKGTHYTYQVVGRFGDRRGTGHSTDPRPRVFTFVKN
ncbi:MAG: hypothetical protein JO170_17745 [Verrucomicrobia bacterium]|nr:hypothetical protein [Verrucomicrobiota bacterium]